MIVVDSSVWIDLFADRPTIQVNALERIILSEQRVATGDLIVMEVLQGARGERHARKFLKRLDHFVWLTVCGKDIAIKAAEHYRSLRDRGITVRKTIDTLIATRCIVDDLPLLYADRDFDPFVEHFGLRSALATNTAAS